MQNVTSPIRIFLSSAFQEFKDERFIIRKALEDIPLTKPVFFEEMAAAPKPIFDLMRERIESADIFMLLIGNTFSEATRVEYEVARALNKPILVLIKEIVTPKKQLVEFLEGIPTEYVTFKSAYDLGNIVKNYITSEFIRAYRRFDIHSSDFKKSNYKQKFDLQLAKSKPDKRFCFVIMPIGKQGTRKYDVFKNIFDLVIKPAVEIDDDGKLTGLRCERADQEVRTGNIPRDIMEKLLSAEIVIADLTTRNPNVFYELGVRHSLRQKTIMISQSVDDIPFDISNYRTIIYDPIVGLVKESIRKLRLTVRALMSSNEIKDSPVLDWVQK